MADMMLRLGIDPVAAARCDGGEAYSCLQRTCLDCRRSGDCRAWLDGDPAAPHPAGYCRNFLRFLGIGRA